ncbi:hypothetical protein COCC4DRAFT_160937 [Bipolaris maydis ATCC 48331]|uniref:Uncharacterized protein n=2 Tax=Cochliobolus heterostrophus TaxID=5016 RepID=M2TZJ8_COCH5|nr:uncharacterized protein COCC4DRAFT_160937 [Bipolaris maydis ATCC 48331]EMD91709.1 hypothetical protein COCHEDRAFT_1136563 [Bipolaris maydis C5]KAH7559508.1 hypothetical protein BM1_04445 [Bipolaris maydis]ENI08533.1 hypothetical protein COCC4DRAFT_160937 [Bipolaris maydis ATCC 48331]KAJ5027144.1 hypothetical protein J3E73DRAFT_380927 [Bipolaris maydis]KAJ5059087.1 hypothetical protein J3E74DRAFT_274304 [Bipolaris maydis]
MITESIKKINGYDKNASIYYPVIIVGAGASGIAAACQLKAQLGFDQFRVFDRQTGIGGTWWINRYPGVACDIPAVFYSFSFAQNPNWSAFRPPGKEIAQYYHDVCEKYQVIDKFELNTDIQSCKWLDNEALWEVTLRRLVAGTGDLSSRERMKIVQEKGEQAVYSETQVVKAKVVLSCVGGLVEPRAFPENIKGIEKFKGRVFHSARWDDTVNLTDKNVVVVGSGCSSAQVVPPLPHPPYNAKSVTQIMRSPPWVVASVPPPGGDEWWSANMPWLMRNIPGLKQIVRFVVFFNTEKVFFQIFPNTPISLFMRAKYQDWLLDHMRKTAPKKYWDMLTPDYGVGCKRRIYDQYWLNSLNDPKIELTTQPLNRITETGVIVGPGASYPANAKIEDYPEREIPADIIVHANGFDTTRWLHPLKVIGKEGKDIVQVMEERGGAQAYQGTAMDGFPNFMMIFGPNTVTGHSSVLMASENMINYSINFIRLILTREARTFDVKPEAEKAYTAEMQRAIDNTVWKSGCSSWYFTENGWNSTVYPYSQVFFWYRCLFVRWSDWNIEYTREGLVRMRMRMVLRMLVLLLVGYGIWKLRLYELGLREWTYLGRIVAQASMQNAMRIGNRLRSSIW